MTDNLPTWPGAAGAYARAYRIARHMAKNGYVEVQGRGRNARCHVKPELSDFIDALNRGDEERIKALNIQYRQHDVEDRNEKHLRLARAQRDPYNAWQAEPAGQSGALDAYKKASDELAAFHNEVKRGLSHDRS